MKIGVFDSGIGGLTVLKEVIKKYPNADYIYFGDTLNLPYGEKTKEQLFEYTSKIIEFLISQKVDKIIIACGTICSNVYDKIKDIYPIEIINIIEHTITKIKKDNISSLAVIATNKTIESHLFKNNLPNIQVTEIACTKFFPFIENDMGNKDEVLE